MSEKRRYQRISITGELAGNVIYKADIHVLNISLGGICFLTEKRLNPGSNCLLELRDADCACFKINGRVVRANLKHTNKIGDDIRPVYEIAVEFVNLTGPQKVELEKLINRFSECTDSKDS